MTFSEAALGAGVKVPTMNGPVTLKVPAGTPSGKTFRIRGKGAPKSKGGHGDLLVTVEVDVPSKLSKKEKELLESLRDEGSAVSPGASRHGGRDEVSERRDESSEPRPVQGASEADDRAVYMISVAAELAGVHPQTLRIYERKGLVQPKRTAGNTPAVLGPRRRPGSA